ncbi:MAG: SsrA-binding protein [Candidatus Yanofskybacteria bacterium CG10_big_fil_rev_8_21_14_0_10_36_16]|uniref:SsrA-binding protein n=1 Tax=Candidatus Yanofskybacteria bacterium CG10_big_fil_rev_8_21_14_0_10_36_16 TaxID=1975096 RepID=A0A2J0Q7Z2_9BACT|nr:MAG: SsrA-binding protein [Candidatus Yanofskybacteria bacterium CG10_big_fil_rev_8_21_14_0_10_36_16]
MSVFAINKKARFDYEIKETLEAGLVLLGHEVKSIKIGKVSIKGAYVKIIGGEAWLIGAVVPPYQPGNIPADYDEQRNRKLLLKRQELDYVVGKAKEGGLTLVPIKLYNKKGLIKLEVGVGRGKKKADKRDTIKKRETKRQIGRAMKS